MDDTLDVLSTVLTTETICRYVSALPALGETAALDERAVQAARSALARADPAWEEYLKTQINILLREVAPHLDRDYESGRYALTATELRGIIARAVSRVSSQLAVDIGQALSDILLAAQFAIPQTDDESDENTPAESYRQSGLQQNS